MAYALIIEDDQDTANLFVQALQTLPMECEIVWNGAQAMDILRKTVPDLVLVDMNLPGLNGVEVVEFIRSESHLKDIAVIVTSGDAEKSKAVEDLVEFVLLKPISLPQLITMVRRLF